jgi:hypothetical protein
MGTFTLVGKSILHGVATSCFNRKQWVSGL